MVLAAGIGSRLRPLTDACPKALIEVGGVAMLELVVRRLIAAGTSEIIVNVFHFPELIADFLKSKNNFGIRVELSRETALLDTGGGLLKAAPFFDDGKPFLVHNVDVLSEVDLGRLHKTHLESGALATLSVRSRPSGRYLLFDGQGRLCGREAKGGERIWARAPVDNAQRLAFDGIHVISPEIFPKMTESGVFSIIAAYPKLAGEGETIAAFRADDYYWKDIGGLSGLSDARAQETRPS